MSDEFLSVADAAQRLGLHRTRINQLIDDGLLPAQRIGRAYIIRSADLDAVKDRPSPGRPSLTEEEKAARAAAILSEQPKAAKKVASKKAAKKSSKKGSRK